MNFDELKSSWQTQPLNSGMEINELKATLDNKWNKYQQSLYRTNICMTLGFLAATIVITWVFFAFQAEFGLAFKLSLASTCLLMIVFAAIAWRSYDFKKDHLEVASTDFIKYQLQKISWQRKVISQYIWIYMVLLWLAVMTYMVEILAPASATLRYSAIGITTLFLVIVAFRDARKQKSRLARLDDMTAELEQQQKMLISN
ncbi:hypothetical protein GCM10011387_21880 [Pedobacter quisquiliarum]|uniref:Uncharacterized protein n=1 Tax=Pedobacter quisquiliarum TaxID=1834438 RepID=A0A916UDD5_9SPHI|nr:hypothetical protein [Pedobacter quisquiliarum]GGC68131.1 hypothetical protein GCM10011387_21880 [Pedobacter quisquiliarum]